MASRSLFGGKMLTERRIWRRLSVGAALIIGLTVSIGENAQASGLAFCESLKKVITVSGQFFQSLKGPQREKYEEPKAGLWDATLHLSDLKSCDVEVLDSTYAAYACSSEYSTNYKLMRQAFNDYRRWVKSCVTGTWSGWERSRRGRVGSKSAYESNAMFNTVLKTDVSTILRYQYKTGKWKIEVKVDIDKDQ